jgi:hypothetical protein
MINPFNPLELLPYIRDEEYASPLIERYVGASPLERQRIMDQAKELERPPVILDFHFPKTPTGQTEDLLLFKGYATAEKTDTDSQRPFQETRDLNTPNKSCR